MADRDAWGAARNVLAVRLDAMGDVLMTTPALRAIRQSARDARLTLLTSGSGAAVVAHVPEVDAVIAHDVPWMKATRPRSDEAPDLALLDRLRAEGFDAAVIFTVWSQSPLPAALLCWLAGIPLRLAHSRDKPYQLLSDWVPDPEGAGPTRHEVARQLALVANVGYETSDTHLSFRVPAAASRHVRAILAATPMGATTRGVPWVVIHPGASAPSRQWPAERYATVARWLADQHGWTVVTTGSADEAAMAGAVAHAAGDRGISLAGRLSLPELAALLAVAPLLITNNTGPAHLAAAVGTPLVDVYAATNPQHTPWQVRHRLVARDVPCKGCERSECPLVHHACLRSIEPGEVIDAALGLTAEVAALRGGERVTVGQGTAA